MSSPLRQSIDLATVFRRIRVNIGILLGGSGIVMLLNFATAALNARAVGPEGLGVIALFQASALMMVGVFSFGTQQPMIRLGKQALENGDLGRLGAIGSLALLVDYLAAAVAGVVSLVLLGAFAQRIGIEQGMVTLAQFYTIVVFLSGVTAANGVFRLFNRFHYLSVVQVGGALVLLAVSTVFYLLQAPLSWYLVAYAIVYAVTVQVQVALAVWTLRNHGAPVDLRPSALHVAGLGREFFSYAWTTNLTGVINSVRVNGEPLLLGALFGTATVGVYNVVRQVAGAFNKLATAGSSAIFPEVAELASRREFGPARRLLNRLALLGFLFGVAGIVAMAILGRPVLRIAFGPEFVAGYVALLIMGVAGALTLSSASFGGFVQAFVSPLRLLQVYGIAFCVYGVTAPLLIYNLGLNGAPLGQAVFALALWAGCWVALLRVLPASRSKDSPGNG
jgi:O-antigen/teichoic acid export membrane protein